MSNANGIIVLIIFIIIVIIGGSVVGLFDIITPQKEPKNSGLPVPEQPIDWTPFYIGIIVVPIAIFFLSGIRIVRQTHRAVIETFGKYTRFMDSGITWIIPVVQRLYSLNVTEQLVDVQQQDVITFENLNARVDAQVYYRIGKTEKELWSAFYNVDNVNIQMVQLAKSTLRAVIGKKYFKDVNSKRAELNNAIFETLTQETKEWGIVVVRVELKEIEPPKDVQDTMNAIIKAENRRDEAKDLAKAKKIEAEGDKLARIQRAEGFKREKVLQAEGEAKAIIAVAEADAEQIKLVNTSAQLHFRQEAIILKHLQVTENALKDNMKYVVTEKGISPTLVLNETAKNIIPVPKGYERSQEDEEKLRKNMVSTYVTSRKKQKSKHADYIDVEGMDRLFG